MPNIHEKGLSVPTWIASISAGAVLSMGAWAFNSQTQVNEKVLEMLSIYKEQLLLASWNVSNQNERIIVLEKENKEIKKEIEKQRLELEELKRYHK